MKRSKKEPSGKQSMSTSIAQQLTANLRERGFRITKVRQSMIEEVAETQQPLSALEIFAKIARKHVAVNKATIYRELDFLVNTKILAEIDILDGVKRYELLDAEHHHHHLVCTSCRTIQCVEVPHHDLHRLEDTIHQTHSFTVQSHVLEFFGLCDKCC